MNTAWTAWLAEARYEAVRAVRRPGYIVPVLILPVVFFLVFGVFLERQNGGTEAALHALVGYGVYGVLAATIVGLASAVATDREFGLLLLKRALPVPPGAYLGAKVATALAIAAAVNVVLILLSAFVAHVPLQAGQFIALLVIAVGGGLPFAAIGMYIGSRASAAAAPGISNAVYLPMCLLGGLWIPLQLLPPFMGQFARFLPSYHLMALSLASIGRGDGSAWWVHVAVLAATAIAFFSLARRRLAFGESDAGSAFTRRVIRAALVAGAVALGLQAFKHAPTTGATTPKVAGALTPVDGNSFVIRGVRLFDGAQVIAATNVVVRDGRIAAIGTDAAPPEDLPVVDGKGRTLLPGLIDAHTHSFGPAREDALRFGVTTELDMFTDWHLLAGARADRVSEARTRSADLWSAGTLATVPHGHGTEYGGNIPTLTRPEEAATFVDARIAEGSDYIKIILEDGSAYGHSLPTLDEATLTALVVAAHARGKMAIAHVATQADARKAIAAGIDGLAHVFIDQPADDALIGMLREHHVFVVATLSVAATAAGAGEGARLAADPHLVDYLSPAQNEALRTNFPPDWQRASFLPNALESIRRLHAAGVPILAGTDAGNPGTAHGATLHQEMALLVQAGLSPTEALVAATSLSARVFGLQDRGAVRPGLRADLVLVEGDPTQDIVATRRILGVWKNGFGVERAIPAAELVRAPAGSALPADPVIADFDDGRIAVHFGQNWEITTDQLMNGHSEAHQRWESGGAAASRGALVVEGSIAPGQAISWAGTRFLPGTDPKQPVDFSTRHELVFQVRGDGRDDAAMLFSGDPGDGRPSIVQFKATPDWQEVRIPLERFGGADLTRVRGLAFTAGIPAGPFAFELDDVQIR